MRDQDLVTVWALLDAGSAVNVVDFEKHFPGIKVKESSAQRKGVKYLTAGGGEIPNRGEGEIHYKTVIGEHKVTVFQNASVGMPILSTNCVAHEGNDITYRKTDGYLTNTTTGKQTPFIEREGVYFMQMQVPKAALERPPNPNRGFQGHA